MGIGNLDDRTIEDVLTALGIPRKGNTFVCQNPECPRPVKRESSGTRYSAGYANRDSRSWKCWRCQSAGSTSRLAAFHLCGSGYIPSEKYKEAVESLVRLGLVDENPIRRELNRRRSKRSSFRQIEVDDIHRPPRDEIKALWEACLSVSDDEEVSRWAISRKWERLELLDKADVLRAMPEWYRAPWLTDRIVRRHRAVLPVYDVSGDLVSLKFRAIHGSEHPKSLSPNGKIDPRCEGSYSMKSCVLANVEGRELLQNGAGVNTVHICEGEPDFLTLVYDCLSQGKTEAVFGIWSGAWSKEIADRIPTGSTICIYPHADEAGKIYFDKVVHSIGNRCRMVKMVRGE